MSTQEQVQKTEVPEVPELAWGLSPTAVEGVRVLLALLETEYAGLKEQYDRVETSGVRDYDLEMHVFWWLDDIRTAVDALEAVDATPEVDES